MATFVLVHPAWFGGWCWRKVVEPLRAQGHEVHTPTLTGFGEREHLANPSVGLDTHIQDVVNLLAYEDIEEAILVGSSSAGAVITGVAHVAPERIGHVVYLDAFVIEAGRAIVDAMPPDRRASVEEFVQKEGEGWLFPRFGPASWERQLSEEWAVADEKDLAWILPRLVPAPFRHFTDPVPQAQSGADGLRRTFVRCHKWSHAGLDRYALMARETEGWVCRDLDTSHLPYITDPESFVDLMLELVGASTASTG